jgi:hypothetical protein
MVGTKNVNDPVEISPFPDMVGKVACSIYRGTVTPADNVLVCKAEILKVKGEALLLLYLGEVFLSLR